MYRATETLFMRGKPIKPGQIVPADYPKKDLQLAIKREWVKPAGVSAVKSEAPPPAPPPEAPKAKTRKPPKKVIKDRQPKVPRKTTRDLEPPDPPPYVARVNEPTVPRETLDGPDEEDEVLDTPPILLGDLPFLGQLALESLHAVGMSTVSDLEGWDEDMLIELSGIGRATARKLMEEASSLSPADGEGA